MRVPEVTPELCEKVVAEYVTPMFEANLAQGAFGRRDGSLVIARARLDDTQFDSPDLLFKEACVVYEHSWGQTEIDGNNFSQKALQKVFCALKFQKDYDLVLRDNLSFVKERGLIEYPGAVFRDIAPPLVDDAEPQLYVAGYAGLCGGTIQ